VVEFDTGSFGCELPIGLGVVKVSIALPGSDLFGECLDVGDATAEALRAASSISRLNLSGSDQAGPPNRTLGNCGSLATAGRKMK
jgi:hypothetical protein